MEVLKKIPLCAIVSEFTGSFLRVTEEAHQPSHSALAAAAARAAHLIVDAEPHIFHDTLAEEMLGAQADYLIGFHRQHGDHVVLAGARAQVVIRSFLTEAALTERIRQYVILGAGLDSYAYRGESTGLNIFEVDRVASQRFKRARLNDAGIVPPPHVSFVAVDFEIDSVAGKLHDAGFDPQLPTLVSWLGVSMYLTRGAIRSTLRELATLATGVELIFDYMLPTELRDADGQTYVELVTRHNSERGEPWLSFFAPDEMARMLKDAGFASSQHLSQAEALPVHLWQRSDALRPARLSMIAHARL